MQDLNRAIYIRSRLCRIVAAMREAAAVTYTPLTEDERKTLREVADKLEQAAHAVRQG